MKSLKRISILILFFILGTSLFAQRVGFEVGGALTGLEQSTPTAQGDFSILTGATAGPVIEFKLSEKFGLLAGALFELRAGRYDISWYKPNTTYTRTLYYAQAPIHITYRKAIKGKNNWMFFAGPRINVGLFGTTNEHYYMASRPQVNDSSCFAGGNAMHRIDIGLDLGVALELDRWQFKLNYILPVTNSAYISDYNKLKQHQLQFSIGLSFNEFKKKVISTQDAKPAVVK